MEYLRLNCKFSLEEDRLKILEEDLKKGIMKVRVESDSDLWLLHTILSRGDLVTAKTTREVKIGEERRKAKTRIPMVLTVKVEYSEFQPFTGRLRIHGVIVCGPEKFGLKGSHHTLTIGLDSELTIAKDKWSKAIVKKLTHKRKRTDKTAILAIDYEEATLGILYDYGLNILFTREFRLPGKDSQDREEVLKREIRELVEYVSNTITSENIRLVVVSGPGFLKDVVASLLNDSLRGKVKVEAISTSTGGVKGVREAIKREEFRRIVRDVWSVYEIKALEEFLKLLAKNPEKTAYSVDEVLEAARVGAVSKVMVLDEMLKTYDEELRAKVERVLEEVESHGGEVIIFSSHGSTREELKSLGGIIAILRFKVKG